MIKTEQEAIKKFDDEWESLTIERENDPSIGDSGTYREYSDDKLKAFITEVWQSAYQSGREEAEKEVIRQLTQIDKYDSFDVVSVKLTRYLVDLKAKYNLSEKVKGD